jgi:hypothetical protein
MTTLDIRPAWFRMPDGRVWHDGPEDSCCYQHKFTVRSVREGVVVWACPCGARLVRRLRTFGTESGGRS